MMCRVVLFFVVAMLIAVVPLGLSAAQRSPVAEPLALKGYDPVAYFTDGKAAPGTEQHQLSWDGVRYRFATPEHQEMFRGDPDKFAPQFAGSCTMGMAAGKKVDANPDVWLISDGKLYLFFSTEAREKFIQNPAGYLAKAQQTYAVPSTKP